MQRSKILKKVKNDNVDYFLPIMYQFRYFCHFQELKDKEIMKKVANMYHTVVCDLNITFTVLVWCLYQIHNIPMKEQSILGTNMLL